MANKTPFATNPFGVQVQPIDHTQPGAPTVQLYHGGSVVVNGNIVGRIDEWHPAGAYNRDGAHVYEVHHNTWGAPVDYVPGRVTGFNITWTRGEVWEQELELTLGYGSLWKDLTDQTFPFESREFLFRGINLYRTWSYSGCWFTEKNPVAWSSEGDGRIKVNCNMAYVRRNLVS